MKKKGFSHLFLITTSEISLEVLNSTKYSGMSHTVYGKNLYTVWIWYCYWY